ncbi:MAG: pyrroline-5-carboxylate reductase [Chloroflexi bacterium]|nr:pyrroline-5-carboxylate reductase [Chloroflexota bacterium]
MTALKDLRLAMVGSGNMVEAMIGGLLRRELAGPQQVVASGPRQERADELHKRYSIDVTTDNVKAAHDADIIVLGVKPLTLPIVTSELRGKIKPESLVISIAAGARIKSIARGLHHQAIVRVMPNTPAQIGQGISVWTATRQTDERQRAQAQQILSALGEEIYMQEERYLDMATAVSGNGPSYVFLFMEAMIDAGVHLGFPRRVAQELVLQTMAGSVAFARQSAMHPAELRNMVTSPGGTSAESLYQLEKGSLRTVVSRAIWAGYQKSKLLGDLSEAQKEEEDSH